MRATHAALALLALSATAAPAQAHDRSVSYSWWQLQPGGAEVRVRVRFREVTAITARGLAPVDALPGALTAAGCTPVANTAVALPAADGWARFRWRLACGARPTRIDSALLVDDVASHTHVVVVRDTDGDVVADGVLDATTRAVPIPAVGDGGAGAGDVVLLGVTHVLSGWDHLLFLLVLLLGCARLGQVAVAATGFTLGHSLTLVLATTGVVSVDIAGVEALIAASIIIVAAEDVWLLRSGQPARYRVVVACVFGLIHGFGFASALTAAGGPVPAGTLIGFNVGVELGQLAAIAVAWPMLAWLRNQGRGVWRDTVVAGATLAASLGAYWVVERSVGG